MHTSPLTPQRFRALLEIAERAQAAARDPSAPDCAEFQQALRLELYGGHAVNPDQKLGLFCQVLGGRPPAYWVAEVA